MRVPWQDDFNVRSISSFLLLLSPGIATISCRCTSSSLEFDLYLSLLQQARLRRSHIPCLLSLPACNRQQQEPNLSRCGSPTRCQSKRRARAGGTSFVSTAASCLHLGM